MTNNLPAISSTSLLPSNDEWKILNELAQQMVPTGFLPASIKTPTQALLIMLKGRELGVPPLYAASNIVIIQGKPTVNAEMMLALIYRDHGKSAIRVKASDDHQCTIEYRLAGWADVIAYSFTIEQAQKAGLMSNQTWQKYPAAMLRARCISAVARMAFPECIAGMYVPGELGDDVTVTDEGEVISAGTVATATVAPLPDAPGTDHMARLHAVASKQGISHADLHRWATQSVQVPSLRDVEPRWLKQLAGKLEDDGKAAEFRNKYQPPSDDAPVIEAEVVESEPSSLFDDDELAALNADADRIQRREAVRS